jgi:hypothetical protein
MPCGVANDPPFSGASSFGSANWFIEQGASPESLVPHQARPSPSSAIIDDHRNGFLLPGQRETEPADSGSGICEATPLDSRKDNSCFM